MDSNSIICDAIREKGPTIQKIDFRIIRDSINFSTDLSWGAIRNFLSTLCCEIRIIEKKSLNAFRAAAVSSIARRVNFHFWIVGPFSRSASHIVTYRKVVGNGCEFHYSIKE